jgi:hypothetical protein
LRIGKFLDGIIACRRTLTTQPERLRKYSPAATPWELVATNLFNGDVLWKKLPTMRALGLEIPAWARHEKNLRIMY